MMTIREAEEVDLPQLVELLWNDEHGKVREDRAPHSYRRYLAALQTLKADPTCFPLVAVENGALCGYLQLNILSGLSFQGMRRGLIEDLRVVKTHRRKGIGKLILEEAVRHARSHGCGMIELFVHGDRIEAHAFYEACGFEGTHRGYRQRLDKE